MATCHRGSTSYLNVTRTAPFTTHGALLLNRSVTTRIAHVYKVRPRKDKRGVDLISDVLPFGRLWYDTPDNAIAYAKRSSRSGDAVIRIYDDAGNVIETYKYKGDFREW
jgi:hypothetical protein